jgi:hypothetical protein
MAAGSMYGCSHAESGVIKAACFRSMTSVGLNCTVLCLPVPATHARPVPIPVLPRPTHTHPDGSAAKRQAAEEAAKASRNKERLQQMFAKAAGAAALCMHGRQRTAR